MIKAKTIATIALAGAVTFSPMLALADTNVDVSVNADANASTSVKHPLLSNVKMHMDANEHSSTTADHKAAGQANKEVHQQDRGEKAVDTRISLLQKLEDRINAMKRLSTDQKTSIVAELSAQISAFTDLKTKIGSDSSTTTLIADLKSIRPDFRTYILVMPRTAIIAAANRVMNITTQMTTEGTKLDARITAAQNAGADVTSAQTASADFKAKVADAKVQAQAALDLVVNLKVDQGDSTQLAANTAAIKSARAKLQAARADLTAARKDMATIMQTVKGKGLKATASTTAESHS